MKNYKHILFIGILIVTFVATSYTTVQAQGIIFNSSNLYPEGIAYHKASKTIFVSSMKKGSIGTVTPDGTYKTFIDDNFISTSGLSIDNKRNRLFAAIVDPGVGEKTNAKTQKKIAAIAVYDIKSKKQIAYINLQKIPGNENGPHFVNEIVIAKDGSIYASDSFSPLIYKISSNLQDAQIFLRAPSITGEGFNFNGLALVNKDKTLLALKYNSGEIFSIDIKTKKLTKLALPKNINITGADGFITKNNIALIAHNSGNDGISIVKFNKNYSLIEGAYTYRDYKKVNVSFANKQFKFYAPLALSFPTTIAPTPWGAYVLNASLNDAFAGKSRKTFSIIKIEF